MPIQLSSPRVISEHALQLFLDQCVIVLRETHTATPTAYYYSFDQIPEVVERFRVALRTGAYLHDTKGIKLVCKRLGIPNTRKAITAFLYAVPITID